MRMIDLCCGAGGAAVGYHRAGFEVVGVDIRPQPNFPFEFHQADALAFPLDGFDFIHASPPCQAHSWASQRWIASGHRQFPDLIEPTRQRLLASGVPFVIENVVGAPIRCDLFLTGEMFGLRTHRRRHFEFGGWWSMAPCPPPRKGPLTAPGWCTVAGHGGSGPASLRAWSDAMGIDWMTKDELKEAIPPAYSEYIGRAAMRVLRARSAT